MPYEIFARVYDEVMDETIYPKWLDFTTRYIPTDKVRLLELACGTGALACELSFSGFDVTGLDLSEDMLTLAVERANDLNADVQFVNGDMRDLSEVGTYEVVTCYSDSLCYMKNRQEMQEVFDSVSQVLEEDGYFLFDVHSTYQMTDIYPDYSYHYSADEFAFMWDSYSGSKPYSIVHELTFFVEDSEDDTRFIRQDEIHHERTYPLSDYLHMLENANFSKVDVYADFTDEAPDETTQRWFFVCKK